MTEGTYNASIRLVTTMLFAVLVSLFVLPFAQDQLTGQVAPAEAPAAFDNQTNGFESQSLFDADREIFEQSMKIQDGLGPVYNATSCVECHQNPVSGGGSQVIEMRVGTMENGQFMEHPGGSLIQDRAIDPDLQEQIIGSHEIRAGRTSLGTLGNGFVEAIADQTLKNIQSSQPAGMQGTIVQAPVLEARNALAVGRFGWKSQHASLESFSADAFLSEMGITTGLQPTENSSNGKSVAAFDKVPDPEDDGSKLRAIVRFTRSTKAPPRDIQLENSAEGKAGSDLFDKLGCAICHVRAIVTAPAGAVVNAGAFAVPPALGNKIIHPYSDFLLHDVGTGDGIIQNGGVISRNKMRTAPLWGLRTRNRLMHDGQARTVFEAILRHQGEAAGVTQSFITLTDFEKWVLLTFLKAL